MDHDQRFKALIREFFAEFMQLFLLLLYLKPRSARKLEFLRLFCDTLIYRFLRLPFGLNLVF